MPICPEAPHLDLDSCDYMLTLSRSRWAWEFLRRNPDFLADAAREPPGTVSFRPACPRTLLVKPRTDQVAADRWGLAFFPDPGANGHDALAFWSGDRFPRQVELQVSPAMPGETCEIQDKTRAQCEITHLVDAAGREHLLVKGNGHVVQVRCKGRSLLTPDPVRLGFLIHGVDTFQSRVSLLADAQRVYGPRPPAPPPWTRTRLALRNALIAWDCQTAGLSLRATASFLYGEARAREAWASPSRAMKDEMRRARKRAQKLVHGGYRQLLAPSPSGRRTV
jgi:type VI secretion system activator RovC-like protein/transcriptional regulator